ncbi:MAG: alpha/beta hydrolase [Deltaproteobacteria bacterium]|nr:alpha/beta hydrolase [Deltaproteobacteria bacterium]
MSAIETKTITMRDGRTIAYVDGGDPNGPLVLHHHGAPSSRLEGALLADGAAANRLRLVTLDRPGYGRSSPHPGWTYDDWANDMVAVADALGYREFGVTGWSGGGPSAYAAAAYIDPVRLRHVTSIAGAPYGAFGDDWAAKRLTMADRIGGFLAMHMKAGFRLMYESIEVAAVYFPNAYYKQLEKAGSPYDDAVLARAAVKERFTQASVECFAQGAEPMIYDSELAYRRWSFDVRAIRRPIHIWQGTADHFVSHDVAKLVADQIPGAVWHPVADGGHFIAIGECERIYALAAQELNA